MPLEPRSSLLLELYVNSRTRYLNPSEFQAMVTAYTRIARKASFPFTLQASQTLSLLRHAKTSFDAFTVGGLAARLGVNPATASRNIRLLEKQGFLRRKRSVADPRAWSLFLTKEGKQAAKRNENLIFRAYLREVGKGHDAPTSQR